MFSSWDEWDINGRCTVHNNESVTYRPHRLCSL